LSRIRLAGRPKGAEKLLLGFEELSPESRYKRFLSPMAKLDPAWVRYFTEIDHHDHEALMAESAATGEPVGVARYIRLRDQPAAAELAVTVVDPWQGKGAATALLRLLSARARSEGITRFRATCLGENRTMLNLMRELGNKHSEKAGSGVVEIEVELPAAIERGNPLHTALTHAASGAVDFQHPVPVQLRPHCPS